MAAVQRVLSRLDLVRVDDQVLGGPECEGLTPLKDRGSPKSQLRGAGVTGCNGCKTVQCCCSGRLTTWRTWIGS